MAPRGGRDVRMRDYETSVRNPLYREAEERVYRWLLARGVAVIDHRDKRTYYDFEVGPAGRAAWKLDVKTDMQAHATGNVAWERDVTRHDGRVQTGWGEHADLDYIVYVLMPAEGERDGPWPLLLCKAGGLRRFVAEHEGTRGVCEHFRASGFDRDGHGCLLNIEALRASGAVLREGEC